MERSKLEINRAGTLHWRSFVTIASVLATATFDNKPWIKGETLRGMFMTALVVCSVWFAREAYRAFKSPSASAENFALNVELHFIPELLNFVPTVEPNVNKYMLNCYSCS